MTRKTALEWLPDLAADSRPFFLQLGFYAPHGPADYQGRYADLFGDLGVPRTPDYDEEDVSDKPLSVRLVDRLTEEEKLEYDELYRRKLRASQFVDDFIGRLVAKLTEVGQLENTYLLFHTDNGVHMGAHRLDYGKNDPYDTDVRFPLYVRGPGVIPGPDDRMVSNADFVPTFASIGGAAPPDGADGASLLPLLTGDPSVPWRDFAFSEKLDPETGETQWGLARDRRYSYVSRASGEEEFYDLLADPYEVESRHADPGYNEAKADLQRALAGFEGQPG